MHAGAIGPLGDRLHAADRTVLPERHGHRALVVRQRTAVRIVKPPGHAPLVAAQDRLAAGKLDGGSIVEGKAARRVSRIDRDRQRLEQFPEGSLVRERQRARSSLEVGTSASSSELRLISSLVSLIHLAGPTPIATAQYRRSVGPRLDETAATRICHEAMESCPQWARSGYAGPAPLPSAR